MVVEKVGKEFTLNALIILRINKLSVSSFGAKVQVKEKLRNLIPSKKVDNPGLAVAPITCPPNVAKLLRTPPPRVCSALLAR